MPATQQTILIAGANSFIGAHCAARFASDGWHVHALLRASSGIGMLQALDVSATIHRPTSWATLRDVLATTRPDVVIHATAQFVAEHEPEQIASLIEANVHFGTQLIDAMAAARSTRFVNISTTWRHYQGAANDAVSLYAATKQAFETVLDYYVSAERFAAATVELPDTYGPHDRRGKLLSSLQHAATTGEALDLSPGEQRIDLLHVDDVVDAFTLVVDRLMADKAARHDRFALTSGHYVTVRELVAMMELATGRVIHVRWGARPYRRREMMSPWDGGPSLRGWNARRSLASALEEMAAEAVD